MPTKKTLSANKGLTVRINLWSLEKNVAVFDSERARLTVKGQVKNELTGIVKKFNDAGELITTLGQWNVEQLRNLKKASNPKAKLRTEEG
jgi:hypothetical protein